MYPATSPFNYVSNVTGLAASTTYYIRAYAQGSGFITYGNEYTITTTAPSAPTLSSTVAVTNITASSASSGGIITSDGGDAITVKGVCWSTSPSPVLGVGNFTTNGTGPYQFGSSITGLAGGTTYYLRAYATNSIGTGYGPVDEVFTTCGTPIYSIGQSVGGGIVFYVDCSGQHGLIMSTSNQSESVVWGCSGTNIGTSSALGTGAANTAAILAGCADRPIAASLASTYTGGGNNDWYLPSFQELGLMKNSGYLPAAGIYWSSTDGTSATTASIYYYGNNWQASSSMKTGTGKVRAIRSF